MTFRSLRNNDLPQARRLWETCFDDPDYFVDWYFSMRFSPLQARGIFNQNTLICMVHPVVYDTTLRGISFSTVHLIGLATLPKKQGQGLATYLLRQVLIEARQSGRDFVILMPAVPDFYKKRGWEFCFSLDHRWMKAPNMIKTEPSKIANYASVSGPCFSQGTLEDWPKLSSVYYHTFSAAHARPFRTPRDWRDLLHDHLLDKGNILYWKTPNNEILGYSLVRDVGEEIIIRELGAVNSQDIELLIQVLYQRYPGRNLHWLAWDRQPVPDSIIRREEQQVAMARITDIKRVLSRITPNELTYHLDFSFQLVDPLFPEENEAFQWQLYSGRSNITHIPSNSNLPKISIGQWTRWLMGLTHDAPLVIQQVLPPIPTYFNDLF